HDGPCGPHHRYLFAEQRSQLFVGEVRRMGPSRWIPWAYGRSPFVLFLATQLMIGLGSRDVTGRTVLIQYIVEVQHHLERRRLRGGEVKAADRHVVVAVTLVDQHVN